ncbi:MAG: K(+)-transporting ATPase subunit F [Burkholderiaceae bacterium]|nr:K(+)-transporting ATPase subunit F [Burkholderiaceae bacterium]
MHGSANTWQRGGKPSGAQSGQARASVAKSTGRGHEMLWVGMIVSIGLLVYLCVAMFDAENF